MSDDDSSSIGSSISDQDSHRTTFKPAHFSSNTQMNNPITNIQSNHLPVPKEFGQFAGTGGLGLKLMMKMGYKPGQGLGTNAQGIVEPIKVVHRAKGMGITTINDDIDIPVIAPTNNTSTSNNIVSDPVRFHTQQHVVPQVSPPKRRNLYNKTKQPYQSTRFDADEGPVIDLRGPTYATSQILNFVSYMQARQEQLEKQLSACQIQRNNDRTKLKTLRNTLADKQNQVTIESNRLASISEIKSRLCTACKSSSSDTDWVLALDQAAAYPEIFAPICASVAVAKLRSVYQEWDPVSDPTLGKLELASVRSATSVRPSKLNTVPKVHSMMIHSDLSQGTRSGTLFDSVLMTVWVPNVRAWILNSSENPWQSSDQVANRLITALQQWQLIVSTTIYQYVLHQICFPQLHLAVDRFSGTTRYHCLSSPMIGFLLPWFTQSLVSCPADIEFPSLVYKLGTIVDTCLVRRPTNLNNRLADLPVSALAPWRPPILSVHGWTSIVEKHLLPGLIVHVRECIKIDPAAQDIQPVDSIVQYLTLVDASVVCKALINGQFFMQWVNTVYQWVSSARLGHAKYSEFVQWFSVWRTYLPHDIWSNANVKVYLGAVLEILNRACDLTLNKTIPLPGPDLLIPQFTNHLSTPLTKKLHPNVQPSTNTWVPTIRDLIVRLLEKHSFVLEPTVLTLTQIGRPIYQVLGPMSSVRALIYWDQDVVFARVGSKSTFDSDEDVVRCWDPVSLEDLIAKCQS